MTPKRAADLKQFCHDEAVIVKTAKQSGKLIPSLDEIKNIYEILEEILKHIEVSETRKL